MTRLQLNDPLPRERIVTTLEGVVNGEEISGALKLDPMKLLSRYFPEPPVPGMLHLVVQLTGEYQPYCLAPPLHHLLSYVILVSTITPSHSRSKTVQGLYDILVQEKLVLVCMV